MKFSSKGSRTSSIFLLDRKYYIFLQLSKANFQSTNSLFEQIVSSDIVKLSMSLVGRNFPNCYWGYCDKSCHPLISTETEELFFQNTKANSPETAA